jgi:hypothetical protein
LKNRNAGLRTLRYQHDRPDLFHHWILEGLGGGMGQLFKAEGPGFGGRMALRFAHVVVPTCGQHVPGPIALNAGPF